MADPELWLILWLPFAYQQVSAILIPIDKYLIFQ